MCWLGPDGTREVAARDFYEAPTPHASDDEMLSGAFAAPKGGYAYEKQKRKIGDYATAAAAVLIAMDGGACASASIAMTNLSDTPVCVRGRGALVGTSLDTARPSTPRSPRCRSAIEPAGGQSRPGRFQEHVAGVMLRRAIERAASRAKGRSLMARCTSS
jgi:carbon-monoxide dehydrogenase medium subunit